MPDQQTKKIRSRITAVGALLLSIAAAACAEPLEPTDPGGVGGGEVEVAATLQRIGSETRAGTPGFPLGELIEVRAVNSEGNPVEGLEVDFRVEAGGGSVAPANASTDADGHAAARWVLGPAEGENRLRAVLTSEQDAAVSFVATAAHSGGSALEALSASTTSMPVGCPVPGALRVRVLDASGNPVAGSRVLFNDAGSDPAEGIVVESDADGIASLAWETRSASETVIARLSEGAEASFAVTGIPTAPNGFATVGTEIYGPDCEPHRFLGVARPGIQWWPSDARLASPDLRAADFAEMRSWGFNIVRIPLNQRYWQRELRSDGLVYEPEDYQKLVRETVDAALAEGLAVMLDLHNSDRGDDDFPDEIAEIQQMADVEHSIPFWRDLAKEYGGNGQVVFQLYTEPNQIDWDLWRNGGHVDGGDTFPPQSSGVAFEAAGMQDLYDAVRAEGADNLVIVNGMHWGYDLSQLSSYALDGYNIVYATHPYDYADKQPGAWDADWGLMIDDYPVMIAEFGDYVCNENGYYTAVLDYADEHGLSWLAWAWWAPPSDQPEAICGFPALIETWDGTPSPTGSVVKQRIGEYRG